MPRFTDLVRWRIRLPVREADPQSAADVADMLTVERTPAKVVPNRGVERELIAFRHLGQRARVAACTAALVYLALERRW